MSEKLKSVSIPNGMEFYRRLQLAFLATNAFQFPTGWNSTIGAHQGFKFRSAFQFPTGWNSTLLDDSRLDKERSFNSQRDGILLLGLSEEEYAKGMFQFPTGWNSTRKDPYAPPPFVSFNSQRDGILQGYRMGIGIDYRRFQFPTGWNSTVGLSLL